MNCNIMNYSDEYDGVEIGDGLEVNVAKFKLVRKLLNIRVSGMYNDFIIVSDYIVIKSYV